MSTDWKAISAFFQENGLTGWLAALGAIGVIIAFKTPELFKIYLEHCRENKRITADLSQAARRLDFDIEQRRNRMASRGRGRQS